VRKLAAILVSDIVGYSRLAGADEDRILARLRTLRSDLIDPTIAVHHGRVVKRTGDGSIIEFRSAVDAVSCAIEVQSGLAECNAGLPPEKRIEYRVGIHLGVTLRGGPPGGSGSSGDSALMWARRSCPLIDNGHYRRCRTPEGKARMAASAGGGRGRPIRSNGLSRRALHLAHPLRRLRGVTA
jgi:hypothetical protein